MTTSMNCDLIRAKLALRCTSDLSAEDAELVTAHLAVCSDCRRANAAMKQTLVLLDQVTEPAANVDVSRIYHLALDRQRLRSRRWRRAALFGMAAAAALLVAIVLPRLEVRADQQHVLVRWGVPESTHLPAPPTPLPEARELERAREQVRVLSQLVQGQRDELEAQIVKFERLEARLDHVQRLLAAGTNRWRSTERDVAALFGIQSTTPKTGDTNE